MLYPILFLVRYLPWWAIPLAVISFELGMHFFNQRVRIKTLLWFSLFGFCLISTGLWFFAGGASNSSNAVKWILD